MCKKNNFKNPAQNTSTVISKPQNCRLSEKLLKRKKKSIETNPWKMNHNALLLIF